MSTVKVPAPKRPAGKGTPPTTARAVGVVGNNIEKPETGATVPFNKRLPVELVKEVKQFCLDHQTNATKLLIDALREYMDNRGAGKARQ